MKKTLALLISGGLLAFGAVTGCTPTPAALPCSAVAGPAFPSHNTNETITVHTVAGANVRMVAAYKSTSTARSTVTNALGFGTGVYDISTATYGFRVPVTVTVAKGAQRGSCATSFTPRAPVVTPPAPLVSVVSVDSTTAGVGAMGTTGVLTLGVSFYFGCNIAQGNATIQVTATQDAAGNLPGTDGTATVTVPCAISKQASVTIEPSLFAFDPMRPITFEYDAYGTTAVGAISPTRTFTG